MKVQAVLAGGISRIHCQLGTFHVESCMSAVAWWEKFFHCSAWRSSAVGLFADVDVEWLVSQCNVIGF